MPRRGRPDDGVALVIHGHFYQPPREDPWTGEVPEQPGAAPFHDWNERITAECYGPNTTVGVMGDDGEAFVVNTFEHLSFNVGPTLLSWLEVHHADLGLDFGPDQWSAAYVDTELPRTLAALPARLAFAVSTSCGEINPLSSLACTSATHTSVRCRLWSMTFTNSREVTSVQYATVISIVKSASTTLPAAR